MHANLWCVALTDAVGGGEEKAATPGHTAEEEAEIEEARREAEEERKEKHRKMENDRFLSSLLLSPLPTMSAGTHLALHRYTWFMSGRMLGHPYFLHSFPLFPYFLLPSFPIFYYFMLPSKATISLLELRIGTSRARGTREPTRPVFLISPLHAPPCPSPFSVSSLSAISLTKGRRCARGFATSTAFRSARTQLPNSLPLRRLTALDVCFSLLLCSGRP